MGIVNIFLGGSGKYVAEELKGTSLYYGVEMPDSLAFDLDTSSSHTGTFALSVGTDLITVDPGFAHHAQDTVARRWRDLDAGQGLAPETNRAGPRLQPTTSVMHHIGLDVGTGPRPVNGLWGMRASGLLAFASFLDAQAPGNAAYLKSVFETRVRQALQGAAADGNAVRINIVASTAGGTGAGTFLPLALWLKQFAARVVPGNQVNLALILFWWTAFSNENIQGRGRVELLSKAKSGSYAILRELELLDDIGDSTSFPDRHYLLWPNSPEAPLDYRVKGKVFDRVFWIGRRADDPEATKIDVYDEGSRLTEILSNWSAQAMIVGAVGQYAQRLVASVTSVDYPKLRVAQRLSGELVEAAIGQLIGTPDDAPGSDVLSNQSGLDRNAFEVFVKNESVNALSRQRKGDAPAATLNLDNLVDSLNPSGISLGDSVARDTRRMKGGYSVGPDEWANYCLGLQTDLNGSIETSRPKSRQAAEALLGSSVDRFRS